MQCPECGAEVSVEGRFCSECGAAVPDSGGSSESVQGGSDQGAGAQGAQTDVDPPRGAGDQPPAQGGAGAPAEQGAQAGDVRGQPAGQGQQAVPPGQGQQAAPAGQGGQQGYGQQGGPGGGGPGGPGGPGGGYAGGGGFDLESFVRELPLFLGAVAGGASAIVLFIVSVILAVAVPSGFIPTMDLSAIILFDLQFSTPQHVTQLLYRTFEEARPPVSALGFVYLLPPLFLFTASKLVASYHGDPSDTLQDSAAAGASIVIGYLPIIVVAGLLVPSNGGQFSLVTAIFLAGLVYPLLFGALGGLAAGHYSTGERRIGTLYGFGGFFLLLVLLFAASFVYVPGSVEIGMVTRLALIFAAVAGSHALGFGGGGQLSATIPFLVAGLSVLLIGFARSYRADGIDSPIDGFTRALTPAVTYTVMLGLFLTLAAILGDPYVQEELGMNFLAATIFEALTEGPLEQIGDFVTVIFTGFIVYPVLLGGGGGALAGWYKNRDQRGGANMRGAR